jgi:hypothetical protein
VVVGLSTKRKNAFFECGNIFDVLIALLGVTPWLGMVLHWLARQLWSWQRGTPPTFKRTVATRLTVLPQQGCAHAAPPHRVCFSIALARPRHVRFHEEHQLAHPHQLRFLHTHLYLC